MHDSTRQFFKNSSWKYYDLSEMKCEHQTSGGLANQYTGWIIILFIALPILIINILCRYYVFLNNAVKYKIKNHVDS